MATSECRNDTTDIDEPRGLDVERLIFEQRREEPALVSDVLYSAKIRSFGRRAHVAINLVTVIREIIHVHRVHIGTDQEQIGRVVHTVPWPQPEATLTDDLTWWYFMVLNSTGKTTFSQIRLNAGVRDDGAAAVGSLLVTHGTLVA